MVRFVFTPFSYWLANYGHVTISGIVAMLLAHGRFKYIKMFGDLSVSLHLAQDNTDVQNASHAVGPTATMLGPQLMSFFPLKSSLQCDFGMIAIVSSVLFDQAELPRQHLHNLGVVGQGH